MDTYKLSDIDFEGAEKRLDDLRGTFDLETLASNLKSLEDKSKKENFWQNQTNAQKVLSRIKRISEILERFKNTESMLEDLKVLAELAEEESDNQTIAEVAENYSQFDENLKAFELESMLSSEDDAGAAIVSIHPGAGGTESQDWSEMLHRMYLRWCENRGYETETLDYQGGDEAGLKSVTFEVKGDYAYGYLKSEMGVHRLVRLSPYDANKRRHTSFASVSVYPELIDNTIIEVKDEDVRIDTFRASGAGGQHVNKTSSAVRITHFPTNIVVSCQSQRSQHKNKESAFKILRSRLYQLHLEKEAEKRAEMESSKKKIEWGSQIRSYVFHPYNLVKDHRTNHETSNTQAVMDGSLDEFIHEYLASERNK
ncbi:MAG: peptide chain release factor 2 [candidate division Zixibacteria bacterium]|nr:peptide chain release factor 2 [candidate division Zixibacteria bacterium]